MKQITRFFEFRPCFTDSMRQLVEFRFVCDKRPPLAGVHTWMRVGTWGLLVNK